MDIMSEKASLSIFKPTAQEGEPMKELASDAPVASLTIGELEILIEQIIARRQGRAQAQDKEGRIIVPVDRTESHIKAIRALRESGRGERLLERLWAARAEERADDYPQST